MTFEELKTQFPTATLDTWTVHENGGGWVKNTATVTATAWIGPNAIVYGNARVSGRSRVFGDTQVSG